VFCFAVLCALRLGFLLFFGERKHKASEQQAGWLAGLMSPQPSLYTTVFVSVNPEAEMPTQEEMLTQLGGDGNTRRDANAISNGNASGDGNTRQNSRAVLYRPTQLSAPKLHHWCHNPYVLFRTLCQVLFI